MSRFLLPGLAVAACCLASACASSRPAETTLPKPRPIPTVVTDTTYDAARRHYLLLPRNAPEREALRERLVGYLLTHSDRAIEADSMGALVDHVASVTELYTPSEIDAGKLPEGLGKPARALVERGEPLGDEARTLSGLLILARGAGNDTTAASEYYERLRRWGFEARGALSNPLEPYETGVLDVWEEHARLTPTPEVLRTLARLYLEQRDALMLMFQSSEHRVPLSAAVIQGVQQTVLNVAAVFLRHGDVASAQTHVEAMGAMGGSEEQLLQLLSQAREDDTDGADAMLNLSAIYHKYGRSDVTRALCLHGIKRDRGDARFLRCLAWTAATEGEFTTAMAWYADAIELAPDDRALYDEILQVLSGLIEQGLFSTDTRQMRLMANRAAELLEERMKRWPDTKPPVDPEGLYLAIGVAEMNIGNAAGAERHLRASLAAKPTASAYLQLGLLLERMGRNAEAADLYREALKLSDLKQGEQPQRAEILERLGDALRMQGQGKEAARMYQRGLALWDENLSQLKGQRMGLAHLRRGVLLGRLSRRSDAIDAFEKAMAMAPDMQETYATILAYLVVSEPDAAFAHRVFRHAINQLSLAPEWKVYFALWLRAIAGRTGASTDGDVEAVLRDMSGGDDWSSKLARFASSKLTYAGLLEEASDLGERTEAHFYEGARRLSLGDYEGAREMFRQVLETRMVNFYEFAMAQELIDDAAAQAARDGAGPEAAKAP